MGRASNETQTRFAAVVDAHGETWRAVMDFASANRPATPVPCNMYWTCSPSTSRPDRDDRSWLSVEANPRSATCPLCERRASSALARAPIRWLALDQGQLRQIA